MLIDRKNILMGCRISTKNMTYTPGYITDDIKCVSPCLFFYIVQYGVADERKLKAWGKMADTLAKYCSNGKEMHFIIDDSQTVIECIFGRDSQAIIDMRPKGWYIPGHPYNLVRRDLMTKIRDTKFGQEHINSGYFGYAHVKLPHQLPKRTRMPLLRNCDKMV